MKDFQTLEELAFREENKRLILVMAEDEDALEAVLAARDKNIITPILIGVKEKIEETVKSIKADLKGLETHYVAGPEEGMALAVRLLNQKKGDLLMKGKISTSGIMKAVLNKENQLRGSGFLSHITVLKPGNYPKLLFMTDAALNIAPDIDAKVKILVNAASFARKLGVEHPKAAAVTAVEKVNSAMGATMDAALLAQMSRRGQIPGCTVDGPLALDNAISAHSCQVKGIETPVGGDADILLMPDIEAGNVFYKCIGYLSDAPMGGLIIGGDVPIVLTSRADREEIKYYSILLGVLSA